jgi:DNA-binding transcriptional ArsR family regulator
MDPIPRGPVIRSRPSLAVELEWALATSQRADWTRDHPGLSRVFSESPELVGRVAALWPQDLVLSCGGSLELMVLAYRGGLLFSSSSEELLGSLDGLTRLSGPLPELASETDADRRVIEARLDLLKSSAKHRREYVRTITEVWDAVGPIWESMGRTQVDRAVKRRNQLIDAGRSWTEVLGSELPMHRAELEGLIAAMESEDELAIVPAYFTHLGLVVDLPGVLVLGVRVQPADPRMGAEDLARRLKAVADPTRLATLGLLNGGPRTVTELARHFNVAQPTMSNHVKLLREAGLVATRSHEGRRQLFLSDGAADSLISEFSEVLLHS